MDGLSSILSWVLKSKSVRIDNAVFGLHYRATVGILFLFSAIINLSQYIGDPIDCLTHTKDVPSGKDGFIDTWCWISSTYNIKFCVDDDKKPVYRNLIITESDSKKEKQYKFYQWIGIILFIQGILFYIPHYLWKVWEGDHIKMLKGNLKNPILDDESKTQEKHLVVTYLSQNFGNYNLYFAAYSLCEFLNWLNVTSQIFYMGSVLDFPFYSLGLDVLNYQWPMFNFSLPTIEKRQEPHAFLMPLEPCSSPVNPLEFAFPTLAKCALETTGPGGTIQPDDILCLLSLNSFNQKIYVFLWFWFVVISGISTLSLVHRVLTLVSPIFRELLLRSKMRLASDKELNILLKFENMKAGDWFILDLLSKNVDPLIFREIVKDLCFDLQKNPGDNNYPEDIDILDVDEEKIPIE